MQVWRENKNKYNLINSAVIEMLEFIRVEGIKGLLKHLVETYRTDFESINYVETFPLMIRKYESLTGTDFYKYKEEDDKYFEEPTEVVTNTTEEQEMDFPSVKKKEEDDDDDIHLTTQPKKETSKIRIHIEEGGTSPNKRTHEELEEDSQNGSSDRKKRKLDVVEDK
jgi:protein phosphatase-4 regulatory subunit 3